MVNFKTKALLSAVLGFSFGLFTYLILGYFDDEEAFLTGVLSGVGFYFLMLGFLVLYEKFINKRYEKFEKGITSPVFYKTSGIYTFGDGKSKSGNIYFCEDGIVCICLEEKPYASGEILLKDIERYQFDEIHLNIFTTDGRVCVFSAPDIKQVMKVLKEKNWAEF